MERPFWKLPADVGARTDVSGNAKVVMAYLVNRIGDNTHCWPSQRQIAKACGLSLSVAGRSIQELVSKGLITSESGSFTGPRKDRRSRYSIQNNVPQMERPDSDTSPMRDVGVPPAGHERPTGGTVSRTSNTEPIPRTNTPPNPPKGGKRAFPDSVLLTIYREYPRKVGRPTALRAISKALTQLQKERDDPVPWLLDRVREFAEARRQSDPRFTPHPATWFNQERYNDDPVTWAPVAIVEPEEREETLEEYQARQSRKRELPVSFDD